jgi:hypothetical protein
MGCAMPHFALVALDGVALGPVELLGFGWDPGDVIHRGGESNLRVVDILDPGDDDPEKLAVLIAEEA